MSARDGRGVSGAQARVPEPLPKDLRAGRLGRRAAELGVLGLIVAASDQHAARPG